MLTGRVGAKRRMPTEKYGVLERCFAVVAERWPAGMRGAHPPTEKYGVLERVV